MNAPIKKVKAPEAGKAVAEPTRKGWKPLEGVSLTANEGVKTSGIKIRGTGAATKGVMARGPMA